MKFMTGSDRIPALGSPREFCVHFKNDCLINCMCFPTASTCSCSVTLPSHIDTDDQMKNLFKTAIDGEFGFGLV